MTKHLIFHKTWNSFKDLFFQFEQFKFLVQKEEEKWLLKNSLNVWGDSWIADGIVIHGQGYTKSVWLCWQKFPWFSFVVVLDNNGFSKGYGFIRFGDEKEQQTALASMMGVSGLGAKPIRVIIIFFIKFLRVVRGF